MKRFRVNVDGSNSLIIEANSEEEARKIAKSKILTSELSSDVDKILFDYETGIPNIRGLRSKLGRTEITKGPNPFAEQDQVATNILGTSGFTRDSRGRLAVTHEGLEELGLPELQKFVTLRDGTKIAKNVIIDEREVNFGRDLSDFSGVVGPIAGAIIMMSPQLRLAKIVSSFLGSGRAARIIQAAVGSAAGKGGEEALDAAEGFQLQDRNELAQTLGQEALLGGFGQGLGEGLGLLYGSMFGKKAPFDNLRFIQQANLGRSIIDLMKLDKNLGREATEAEIKKAIKAGQIEVFAERAVPSQDALNRAIPGRFQKIAETVLGDARTGKTKKYLNAELNKLLRLIDSDQNNLSAYIDEVTKGSLDEQITAKYTALSQADENVKKQLSSLLDDVLENVAGPKALSETSGGILSSREIGAEIQNTLQSAREMIQTNYGGQYKQLNRLFGDLIDFKTPPRFKNRDEVVAARDAGELTDEQMLDALTTTEEALQASVQVELYNGIRPILNELRNDLNALKARLPDDFGASEADATIASVYGKGIKMLDDYDAMYEGTLRIARGEADSAKSLLSTNPNMQLNQSNFMNFIDVPFLEKSRNVLSELLNAKHAGLFGGSQEAFLTRIIKAIDDRHLEFSDPGKSIFSAVEDPNFYKGIVGDTGIGRQSAKKVSTLVRSLRDVNRGYAEDMNAFANLKVKKMISESFKGGTDADDIYQTVIKGNISGNDLDKIFRGLREYDDYLKIMKPDEAPSNKAEELRQGLIRRFFNQTAVKNTDGVTENIDFTKFARDVKRLYANDREKANVLFGKDANYVFRTMDELEKLNVNIKAKDLSVLIKQFNKEKGLGKTEAFMQELEQLAKTRSELEIFQSNRILRDLPNLSTDEVVAAAFRPKNASAIRALEETLDPSDFARIQQASMGKILEKAIDAPGKGTGRITDIFKPENLKSALDAYGDDTLEAMFGSETKNALRAFEQGMRSLTAGEVGRGGTAGTLVAAGIAAGALNLAMLPTIIGLGIMKTVMGNATFLKIAAKTDKGSIVKAIDAIERAGRQFGIRLLVPSDQLQVQIDNLTKGAEEEGQALLEELNPLEALESERKTLRDLRDTITIPQRTTNIPMPQITPVATGPLTAATDFDDRVEFAERLAGRRII